MMPIYDIGLLCFSFYDNVYCLRLRLNCLSYGWKLLTAIATAISDSVTVSIGDDTNGARNDICLVNGDVRSTSSAVKSMKPGKIMKSL